MGLKEGKVAVKLRFRWLSLTEYIITICRCANWRIRIRVDGKQIYKKSGFKFLRPLVSVFPGHIGGTLLKFSRWLLKLDTYTTMNTFFHFFSGKCRQIIADALNGSCQGTLKGSTSDWVTMNSWIPSFSSTGTSFRPHMHGQKLFRGRGSFSSAGSSPWDMEGGGVGRSPNYFWALRALLWSKNTGGGPPLDPPMFSQPSQRKRVLNEKQVDPFARGRSWQQRTRMLWFKCCDCLALPRVEATGRVKVFMSLWWKVLSLDGEPTIDEGRWPG